MELARSKDEVFDKLEYLYKLYDEEAETREEELRLKTAIYSILWTTSYSIVDVLKADEDNFDYYMKHILKYRDFNIIVNFASVG